MSFVNLFEKKFLFSFGRHLWNIAGVSGFMALMTGLILFAEGNIMEQAKTKENFIGKKELITDKKLKESTINLLTYEQWKNQLNIAVDNYSEYSKYKEPFEKKLNDLIFERENQNNKYEDYLTLVASRNDLKKSRAIASPFVILSGLGVIASSSISSVIFSIERNQRKEEN